MALTSLGVKLFVGIMFQPPPLNQCTDTSVSRPHWPRDIITLD